MLVNPAIFPRLLIVLGKILDEFKEQEKSISAGVAATGDAASYAEVWEWGNVRQTQQGPKTVLGTNPDGDKVWLSIQAPSGYIKINENRYWEIYRDELSKVEFNSTTKAGIKAELERAHRRAAVRCAVIVSNAAPVDSGQLSENIVAIDPGDRLLEPTEDDEFNSRTLTL